MKKIFSRAYWSDQDIETLVGQVLRAGVITACLIVLTGGIYYIFKHGLEQVPDHSHFSGETGNYTTLTGILYGVLSLRASQIIQLGVVVLIATPILRILCSLFGFILEKDKLYIAITLTVLLIITFSILSGVKG